MLKVIISLLVKVSICPVAISNVQTEGLNRG